MGRLSIIVLSAALLWPRPAEADWASDTFAHFAPDQTVADVAVFETSGRRLFTHLLIGKTEVEAESTETHLRVLLLRCAKRCHLERSIFLGRADDYRLAVVDLRGSGGSLNLEAASANGRAQLATKGLRWPALVIETSASWTETAASRFGGEVTGARQERQFSLISLRRRDRARPRLFSSRSLLRSATGAGVSRSYRLRPADRGRIVELEEESQRLIEKTSACLPPEPTVKRYGWRKDRFEVVTKKLEQGGC